MIKKSDSIKFEVTLSKVNILILCYRLFPFECIEHNVEP